MENEFVGVLNALGCREITSLTELPGGAVHRVYRVIDRSRGELIAKVRGPRPKEAMDFTISADEIRYEAAGLTVFGHCGPSVPKLYGFDIVSGTLLMSPIVPGGTTLKSWIDQNGMITVDVVLRILRDIEEILSTGKIHDLECGPLIDKDDERFSKLLRTRFRYQDQTIVEALNNRLVGDRPARCFIMGGLSFKNILFNGFTHGFCDFETFCFGHPTFDFGYYLGHALLHLLECGGQGDFLDELATSLSKSKLVKAKDEAALVTIMSLTVLYRLTHPIISYGLRREQSRGRLKNTLNAFLSQHREPELCVLKEVLSDHVRSGLRGKDGVVTGR